MVISMFSLGKFTTVIRKTHCKNIQHYRLTNEICIWLSQKPTVLQRWLQFWTVGAITKLYSTATVGGMHSMPVIFPVSMAFAYIHLEMTKNKHAG